MKKLIAVSLIALSLAFSACAQWIVYDPRMNAQQILDTAQQIAKQVEQIQMLTQQLTEFKNYEAVFGDPKQVALSMVPSLAADLQKTELGKNLDDLLAVSDGNFALTYDENGIYANVGTSFRTPGGQTIQRLTDQYKPFAAISRTADNFVAVANDAAQRRATLKNQIAQTTTQLRSATTDAEVQKLQGVLTSLNAALASTDDEVNQAASSALVQDIQNRNDQQKQQNALLEQQNAEFHEAISNYTAKFQLMNEPTVFPAP
jgi:hypothetical protein